MRVPAGVTIYPFHVGDEEFALLSYATISPARTASLTPTERAVLEALVCGQSNGQIARTRGVSARTIANHIANAFRKLGIRSRSELAAS